MLELPEPAPEQVMEKTILLMIFPLSVEPALLNTITPTRELLDDVP